MVDEEKYVSTSLHVQFLEARLFHKSLPAITLSPKFSSLMWKNLFKVVCDSFLPRDLLSFLYIIFGGVNLCWGDACSTIELLNAIVRESIQSAANLPRLINTSIFSKHFFLHQIQVIPLFFLFNFQTRWNILHCLEFSWIVFRLQAMVEI